MNAPNLISLGRLFSVPVMVWLILRGDMLPAFWVFAAAGISDGIDGFLAKHFDMETVFGRYLDPLADKALLVSAYVTLGHAGELAMWLVIMVVFRDVLIVGGAILYQTLTQSLTMEPLWVSKLNTVVQIVLAAWVLGGLGYGLNHDWPKITDILSLMVGATTLVSGAAYVYVWTRRAAVLEDRS